MRKRNTNLIDDLTTGLVNNMRFADQGVLYPAGEIKKDDGVLAEWFYDAYKASNGFSELDSINTYITQEAKFEDLGELMMGIALVEMKHLDKLGDVITGLGGDVAQPSNTNAIRYGRNPVEAVKISIENEKKAIAGYEDIVVKVSKLRQNDTTRYILQLIAKLIADELWHISLFETWLKER